MINPFIYHSAFIWGSYAFHGTTPPPIESGVLPPFIGSYLFKDRIFVNISTPILIENRVVEISLGVLENPTRIARIAAKIYNLQLGNSSVALGGAIGVQQCYFTLSFKSSNLLMELEYHRNDILARYIRKMENGIRFQLRYVF